MTINFEETEYPKIDTLFMRDDRKVIIPDQFCNPLFYHLSDLKWEATEKIDGTNIYRCIFQSKKPNAKKFQDWVFKEVLPSISHTGIYATKEVFEQFLKDPESIFKVMEEWKEDREGRLKAESERDKAESERDTLKLEVKKKDSKLEHYEMITKSEHLLTITEVSKFFGTGPVVFCRLMRALKFHRKFRNHYELIQKYSDKNYGKVVEVPVLDENGDPIMWNKQLNYTRAGKEYVAHWWEKIGLISKNGSKQFVFNLTLQKSSTS